jgi:peptidoglycan/LPS O-acetylase OafA/YrhL
MAADAPQKLHALTGLRFFACAMILGHHARGSFGLPIFQGWLLEQGVSLFFVLSGFVLVYSYPELPSWHSRRAFLIKRFARLWPAYIVSIAVVAVAFPQLFFTDDFTWRAITNALMIQTWPLTMSQSFNGPSWSISTEFGFYFLFLWLIIDFEHTWWWKLILAFAIAIVSILLVNNFGEGLAAFLSVSPLARLF